MWKLENLLRLLVIMRNKSKAQKATSSFLLGTQYVSLEQLGHGRHKSITDHLKFVIKSKKLPSQDMYSGQKPTPESVLLYFIQIGKMVRQKGVEQSTFFGVNALNNNP